MLNFQFDRRRNNLDSDDDDMWILEPNDVSNQANPQSACTYKPAKLFLVIFQV